MRALTTAAAAILMIAVISITGSLARAQEAQTAHPMTGPGPFTVRLKFPANYKIPAHWHPIKVTVTVISGTFHMGLGDTLDTEKGKALPTGSIFEMPAKIHHFGWTTEETIIQEHGIGPLGVNYLNPAGGPPHR